MLKQTNQDIIDQLNYGDAWIVKKYARITDKDKAEYIHDFLMSIIVAIPLICIVVLFFAIF